MIDAYEIGIQLALQDDVSAGLAVIARELAEMDRAVAASSAGLAALMRSAEGAVRAVSAAAGVKVPAQQVASARVETGSGEGATPSPVAAPVRTGDVEARQVSVPRSPVSPAEERAAVIPGEPAAPPPVMVRATIAPIGPSERAGAEPAAERPALPVVRRASGLEAGAGPQVRQAAERTAIVTPRAVVRAADRVRPGDAPVRRDMGGAGLVVARVDRTRGDVRREDGMRRRPEDGVAARPEVARIAAVLPSAARREVAEPMGGRSAAVTPRGGGGAAVAAPAAPRPEPLLPRGAAPQAEDRERGQAGGGTVMLDGRMVGYWLAEHMAREASRPPGGTSFFDPRQGPAWTPSGAL